MSAESKKTRSGKISNVTRREFFKAAGTLGLGSVIGVRQRWTEAAEASAPAVVPKRVFGNTGEHVAILGLGGSQDLMSKQLLLKVAFNLGVTYWDTAYSYDGGNSEKAIGKYLSRHADDRKSLFLVSKTSASQPERMSRQLVSSLKRMQTDYIDLYLIHHVSDVSAELTPAVRTWARNAKAKGMIRFFGFSTHSNMAHCLGAAASLGWIDGIMTSYNYRLMDNADMQKAVDACRKAGIGLTAMKTQARFFSYNSNDLSQRDAEAQRLEEHFRAKGFSPEQAKLKAVWANPAIASICSEMPNMNILQANAAASVDRIGLSALDRQHLARYARKTAFGYCAGCGHICESALRKRVPVSDIMRCLMYDHGYKEPGPAARQFHAIRPFLQADLALVDFREAEIRCPQHMPIGRLMKTAAERYTT